MILGLLTSLAFAQPLLNEVGDDGVPEMLRAGPDLPEITVEADFDPYAPLQVVGGEVHQIHILIIQLVLYYNQYLDVFQLQLLLLKLKYLI